MKTSEVDQFLEKMTHWKPELTRLRELALECGLEETLKWGQPCYTHKRANVLLLGNFKDFCTISFFKGVLLKDPTGILEKAGENSRIARIIKFTEHREISDRWDVLKSYVFEAIEIENKGLKVEKQTENIQDFAPELRKRLSTDQKFATAFTALTPGSNAPIISISPLPNKPRLEKPELTNTQTASYKASVFTIVFVASLKKCPAVTAVTNNLKNKSPTYSTN